MGIRLKTITMEEKPKHYFLVESPDGKEREVARRIYYLQDGETWNEEWYFIGGDCVTPLGDWKIVKELNLFEL